MEAIVTKSGLYPYKGEGIPATASYNPDEKYRYVLEIRWKPKLDTYKGRILFIMLNPSTATHQSADPTVTRCVGFAKAWGYGALTVCNIFAWRATDPLNMRAAADPVGPDNMEHIAQEATKHDKVIVAWGNHGLFTGQGSKVLDLLKMKAIQPYYLKLNQSGVPQHPLYLSSSLLPIKLEI